MPSYLQAWGPTGTELAMLAQLTHSPADCATVLGVVDFRLGYPPKKWRNVYKVCGRAYMGCLAAADADCWCWPVAHSTLSPTHAPARPPNRA